MRYFDRPPNTLFDELSLLDYFEFGVILRKKKDQPIPTAAPPGKWLDAHGNVVSRRTTSYVCRLQFQNPAVGDLYYLRLILYKVAGRSFEELRTVTDRQGIVVEHPTFHDAARARGLISGQDEYFICMAEAATLRMPHQLRGLLVTLTLDGGPAPRLWAHSQDFLIEDFLFRLDRGAAIEEGLRIIDLKLQLHGKTTNK